MSTFFNLIEKFFEKIVHKLPFTVDTKEKMDYYPKCKNMFKEFYHGTNLKRSNSNDRTPRKRPRRSAFGILYRL